MIFLSSVFLHPARSADPGSGGSSSGHVSGTYLPFRQERDKLLPSGNWEAQRPLHGHLVKIPAGKTRNHRDCVGWCADSGDCAVHDEVNVVVYTHYSCSVVGSTHPRTGVTTTPGSRQINNTVNSETFQLRFQNGDNYEQESGNKIIINVRVPDSCCAAASNKELCKGHGLIVCYLLRGLEKHIEFSYIFKNCYWGPASKNPALLWDFINYSMLRAVGIENIIL